MLLTEERLVVVMLDGHFKVQASELAQVAPEHINAPSVITTSTLFMY